MNDELPDEAVSPDKLDSLLMALDEIGIEIVDESDVAKDEAEFGAEAPVVKPKKKDDFEVSSFYRENWVSEDRLILRTAKNP